MQLKQQMDAEKTSLSAFPWLAKRLISTSRDRIMSVNEKYAPQGGGITREAEEKIWSEAQEDSANVLFGGILLEASSAVGDGTFNLGTVVDVFNDNIRGTMIEPYRFSSNALAPEVISDGNRRQLEEIVKNDPTYASIFDHIELFPPNLRRFIEGQSDLLKFLKDTAGKWKELAQEFFNVVSPRQALARTKTPTTEDTWIPPESDEDMKERGFSDDDIKALLAMANKLGK